MAILFLASLAQAESPSSQSGGNLILGFSILGLILFLAMAVAYLLGRRNTPAQTEQHCPKCHAVRRGEFCAICGTKF